MLSIKLNQLTRLDDYYRDYEQDAHISAADALERHVRNKIEEGEISIGQPDIKAGETLSIIDDGTRYAITS